MHRPLSNCFLACAALGLVACGQAPTTKTAEHPAEVRHTPAETELSTITLTEQANRRLGIETTQVERTTVRHTRTLGGELVVPPGRSVTVTAPVAGSLTLPGSRSLPDVGTLLQSGQELLRLVPVGAPENDLVQREAEARERADAARTKAGRTEQLLRDGAGSRRQMEEARSELAIAEVTLKSIRSQQSALGGAIDVEGSGVPGWSIKSPFRSRLQRIHVAVGQTVSASTPLFELIADDSLWVRVPVYVGDLPSIDREAEALVREMGAWNLDRSGGEAGAPTADAQPVSRPRSANPDAATVDLFFQLDNSAGSYQPGQKVAVTLTLIPGSGGAESLVVPYSAVLYDVQGGTWVYVNPLPHQYVRRRVEIERVVAGQAVLARGPAPGAHVVSVGAAELFGTEFGVGH